MIRVHTSIIICPRSKFQCTVLCIQENRNIQDKTKLKYFFSKLTNGNAAILNGQIDLNIPGGTYNTSPLCCTTAFTFIVLSNFSSALLKTNFFFEIFIF